MNTNTAQSQSKEKVILIGLYGPEVTRSEAEEHLDELERLADTAGGVAVKKILQNRTYPDPDTFIGKGKVDELTVMITHYGADTIIFDDDLTPSQVRNIQRSTKAKIIDRSGLILDIFASRAKTASAKTQVELAQLQYLLPRLTRAWTHLSRQKGGIGTKGPGETQIETDRRLIGNRIAVLKEKLSKLEKQRATQRKGRSDLVRVALVGYTNAGKSSLLNVLTDTSILAEDRLFATLDSTVRSHSIGKTKILVSDTVGFIRKLPHGLIESFKSTLDEIRESDILLHVVDASSQVLDDHIKIVRNTLHEIESYNKPQILVFNKVDLVDNPSDLARLKREYPDAIWVSAVQHIGLDELEQEIENVIRKDFVKLTLKIPQQLYKAISFVYEVAEVEKVTYDESDVCLQVDIHEEDHKRLEKLLKELQFESA